MNVMLKFSPNDKRLFTAKICDFGLAHMRYGDEITASMPGTISHMPPELLEGGKLTFASGMMSPTSCSYCCCCCSAAAPTMPGKAIDGDAADPVEALFASSQLMTACMMALADADEHAKPDSGVLGCCNNVLCPKMSGRSVCSCGRCSPESGHTRARKPATLSSW